MSAIYVDQYQHDRIKLAHKTLTNIFLTLDPPRESVTMVTKILINPIPLLNKARIQRLNHQSTKPKIKQPLAIKK